MYLFLSKVFILTIHKYIERFITAPIIKAKAIKIFQSKLLRERRERDG